MVITGWKSIAGELGVSVATAQRMRLAHGLPVVNLTSRCVGTTPERLSEWRRERDADLTRRCSNAAVDDAGAAAVRRGP